MIVVVAISIELVACKTTALTIFRLRHGRHAPPLDGCDVIKESSRRNKEAKRTSVAWVHYDRKGLEMEKMDRLPC